MFASRYSFIVYAGLLAGAGCASESSPQVLPSDTDSSLKSTESPGTELPQGGQSGTDSDGSYSCDYEGAPPLYQLPLYSVPEGYSCTPDLVLDSVTGTHTFECSVTGSMEVPGATLTVEIFQEGAIAQLLDAVSSVLGEDGIPRPCTLMSIGTNVNVYSPELSLSAAPNQIIVDRFCAYPMIIINARATFAGEEVDMQGNLSFNALSGRLNRAVLFSEKYQVECVGAAPECQ